MAAQSPSLQGVRFDPLLRCIAERREILDGELLRQSVSLDLPLDPRRAFECLRNLNCLVHWWPRAVSVRPLPPGIFGVGDMGILELARGSAWFRVMRYVPNRRLLLALVNRRDVLAIELRWVAQNRLDLVLEAPRRRYGLFWQSLWLRAMCIRAARALKRHLLEY